MFEPPPTGAHSCPLQAYRRYEQDRATRRWYIKVDQTDNLASPWDLRTSSDFVHPDNVEAFAYDVPELGDAEQVLTYIGRTEPAVAFRERGSGGASGDAAVWIRAMERKCKQGHYAGAAGLGRLWEDFRLMISNAKRDNEEAYWEWRAADMLEAELRAVKRRMRDGAGSIAAAKSAVPRVRPRPADPVRKRSRPRDSGERGQRRPRKTPRLVIEASARGGVRRSAATSAMLAIATASHQDLQVDVSESCVATPCEPTCTSDADDDDDDAGDDVLEQAKVAPDGAKASKRPAKSRPAVIARSRGKLAAAEVSEGKASEPCSAASSTERGEHDASAESSAVPPTPAAEVEQSSAAGCEVASDDDDDDADAGSDASSESYADE